MIAGFLSVLWICALLTYGAGYFGWFTSDASARSATLLETLLFACALVIPVILAWVAAFFVSQTLKIRDDARKLRRAVEDLQSALRISSPAGKQDVLASISQSTQDTIRAEQKRVTSQLRLLSTQQVETADALKKLLSQTNAEKKVMHQLVETARDVAEKAQRKADAADKVTRDTALSRMTYEAVHSDDQDALPFEDGAQSQAGTPFALNWDDLTRALNFPQDEQDKDGFAAIKRVLAHRHSAQLLQAAEDVLSMLAQEGIYMDDLDADPANPDIWRNFAAGARGEDIADMGTIEDQAALALVHGRMRTDESFKDASLHFLRLFDKVLTEFNDQATDRDLVTLAGTRSGLAFILLGRANGTFS
jgi:hypothetical protein